MDTITHKGLTFRVTHEHDHDHRAPWVENDGHGPVREASRSYSRYPEKQPGERVLRACSRNGDIFYDFAGAMKIAKRDGWGLAPKHRAELAVKLGRAPKPGEVTAAAVERDFEYLRRYCNDQWSYVGVVVTLLDIDGGATHMSDSLWGVESDSDDYLESVEYELADSIARDLDDDQLTIASVSRGRTIEYTVRELEETA